MAKRKLVKNQTIVMTDAILKLENIKKDYFISNNSSNNNSYILGQRRKNIPFHSPKTVSPKTIWQARNFETD